jgi:hypothetical protein
LHLECGPADGVSDLRVKPDKIHAGGVAHGHLLRQGTAGEPGVGNAAGTALAALQRHVGGHGQATRWPSGMTM